MAGPRINWRSGAGRELCAKTPAGAGAGRQIFAPPQPVANTSLEKGELVVFTLSHSHKAVFICPVTVPEL